MQCSDPRSKMLIAALLATLILVFVPKSHSDDDVVTAKKVYDTSWVEQSTLKWGLLASGCAAQSLTGLSEAYKWGGSSSRVVTSGNYHAYETAERLAWTGFGWFAYANIRSADLSWKQKAARLAGTALIMRNAMEWSYKAGRYGNPFDYTKAHNEHAVVYFKFDGGGLRDAYIGTGPVSGPIVDIACLAVGLLLFK